MGDMMDGLTQRQKACFMAIRAIAAAHPGSKVIPDDSDLIVEMVEVWESVLDMPDEWILPAVREAIRRRRGFPPSVGDVQEAYEHLDSRGVPDAATAVGWMWEAMHLMADLRYESHHRDHDGTFLRDADGDLIPFTDHDRKQRLRALMLERLRESRLSDEYADSLASFAWKWWPEIADGTKGDTTFRAQVRDALKGAIHATTSWRRAKGLNPGEVTARLLGDGPREIGGGL